MIWVTISSTLISELSNSDTALQVLLFGVLKLIATLIGQIMIEELQNKSIILMYWLIKLQIKPLQTQFYYHQTEMRLPNIDQDQNSYKTQYFQIIANKKEKKYANNKIVYDWKVAQVFLVDTAKLDQGQIEALIRFQKQCIEGQISSFYSYYYVQWLLSSSQVDFVKSLHEELELLKTRKSTFHRVNNMIKMRQKMLEQIAQLAQKHNLKTYEKIDDLRFINLQIIKGIKTWKIAMKSDEFEEPVVFLYEGNNYLVKMISDNVNLINELNLWKQNLIYPPNPFFVNQDGSYQGMTKKQYQQVQESMEILANEKAQQLKCIISPPKFVAKYAPKNQYQQLSSLKNQLIQDKKASVNSIYYSNRQAKILHNPAKSQKKDIHYFQQKGRQSLGRKKDKTLSPNSLERMIKESQITVLKQMKNLKVKNSASNFISQHSKKKVQSQNAYQSKIDSLRNKIQLNIKNKERNQLIKSKQGISGDQSPLKISKLIDIKKRIDFTQVKQVKPKIKLVSEKETIVEDVINTLLPSKNLEMYKTNKLMKSQSLFKFKPMQKIQEVNQDKQKQRIQNNDIKPVTQNKHSRTMSLSFFKSKSSVSKFDKSNLVERKRQSAEKEPNVGSIQKKQKLISMYMTAVPKLKSSKKLKLKAVEDKQDRSLSLSPNKINENIKLKTQRSPRQGQQAAQQLRISRIDESLRLVKGRLRDISIKRIYQHKEKGPKSYRPEISRKIDDQKPQQSFDDKLKNPDQQFKSGVISNNNLADFKKSIPKMKKKQNTQQQRKKQIMKQQMKRLDIVKKQQQIKQQMKRIDLLKKQGLAKEQNQAAERMKKLAVKQAQLQQKHSIIQQLESKLREKQQKIKNLSESVKQSSQNVYQYVSQIQQKRKRQKEEFEKQKLRMIAQNMKIQQQMKYEQKREVKLKEQQSKLRQDQIKKKYENQMEKMKEMYNKKLAQAQRQKEQDQRRVRQAELRQISQKKRIQQLKLQLETNKMKQEIMKQALQKDKIQQQQLQRVQMQDLKREKEIMEEELRLQQLAQQAYLKQMEQENQLKKKKYQQMQFRNRKMDQQKLQLQIALKKLDQELQAKVKQSQQMFAHNQYEMLQQQKSRSLWPNNEQPQQQQQQYDLQQLKLRLKKQILEEISRRKKQEELQEKLYQEQRRLKVQKIEQQIKQKLRKQDQELQKVSSQAKLKVDNKYRKDMQWGSQSFQEQSVKRKIEQNKSIKDQSHQKLQGSVNKSNIEKQNAKKDQKNIKLRQQIVITTVEKDKALNVQQEKTKNQNNYKQQQQVQKQYENREQNMLNQRQSMIISHQRKQDQVQDDLKGQELQNGKEIKEEKSYKDNFKQIQSDKQQDKVIVSQIQQKIQLQNFKSEKAERQQEQSQKPQQDKKQQVKQQQLNKLIQSKKEQQKQVKKTFAKPTSQQVLVKYQNLQQYIKKSKQIFIQDTSIPEFLSIFFGQMDHQVKQMLPYSQKQIEEIIKQRKVDIFDSHSIGWLQKQHYILIGNIDCVEAIGRKYGQLQIQVRYIFNKNNPYQKQYLAKKIKVFEHVGYVYQKKLKQQGKFSIKFIIKIPKQVTNRDFKKPSDIFKIDSVLSIQRKQHQEAESVYSNIIINYLLAQTLKYNLSKQENAQFIERSDFQSKQISRRMHEPPINNSQVQTTQIDDNRTQLQISLKLSYIQFYQSPFFIVKATQYMLNEADKLFVGRIGSNLSAVIIESDQSDFGLDTFLNIKTENLANQSQINLAIPIWQSTKSYKLNKYSPREYVYRQKVSANLIYGSIIDTSIKKDSYKVFQPPFIFTVFQTNSANHLVRPLFGTKVRKENLVTFKK